MKFVPRFFLILLLALVVPGPLRWHVAADENFVGADSCATCHQPQYGGWLDSHHERAMVDDADARGCARTLGARPWARAE